MEPLLLAEFAGVTPFALVRGQRCRVALLVVVPIAAAHEGVRLVTIASRVDRAPEQVCCARWRGRDHGYHAQLCNPP